MSKDKNVLSNDEALDLFDDDEVLDINPELDGLGDDGEVVDGSEEKPVNSKLETKKRMDAYLERKWFKDHGWDDDDDLFNDDFFSGMRLGPE